MTKGTEHLPKFEVPLVGDFNFFDVACLCLGSFFSIGWFITRNWLLNNVLGTCMTIVFLKTLRLNQLVPGVLLLSLLFFYDIFWVFFSSKFTTGGQSVMVAVATKLEAPIKLLMPHISNSYPTTTCSMLGLGDIVIPGIYIGFLIRFGRIKAHGYSGYRTALLSAYASSLVGCGMCLLYFGSA